VHWPIRSRHRYFPHLAALSFRAIRFVGFRWLEQELFLWIKYLNEYLHDKRTIFFRLKIIAVAIAYA